MSADDSETFETSRLKIHSFKKPLKWLQPTSATVEDKETGKIYQWNSRAHRKMRFPYHHDLARRPRVWSNETQFVTWYLNITNQVANAFWIISSVFATWPDIVENQDASAKVVYAAGIIAGVFMILSCYLSYVESINHTHADIVLPSSRHHKRVFVRGKKIYGRGRSPVGYKNYQFSAKARRRILDAGYPIVEDFETESLITTDMMDRAVSSSIIDADTSAKGSDEPPEEDPEEQSPPDEEQSSQKAEAEPPSNALHSTLVGTAINMQSHNYSAKAVIESVSRVDVAASDAGYEWWTWHASLNHLGVLCALIGFVSAIVYLIPMCMGYPLAQNGRASVGVTIFFVDVLQVIPYMCFVATGHLYIAEAAGSWWKPKNCIGYYIAVFNTIGGYGFLLCGALAIPVTLNSPCCPNMAKWGAAFACFWGSCSYFIGGSLQIVEFSNPDPIECGCKSKSLESSE